MKNESSGLCILAGAGPGDLGLVTLRAKEAVEQAQVIVYDYLCNPAILKWAPSDAEIVFAGKKAGQHTMTQEEINRLLVERAQAGRRVVRLKGGDPFVFGRGGEELEALARAHIDFSVVPGITAAAGCAAYAGIPLTHREYAHSVSFVTGHSDASGSEPDWRSLAKPGATAVFYMGLGRLDHIATKLIEHGAADTRP